MLKCFKIVHIHFIDISEFDVSSAHLKKKKKKHYFLFTAIY